MRPSARCPAGLTVLMTLVILSVGCGYRPVGRSWPARLGRLRVSLPEGAQLAEPELSRMLELELIRQLGRAGVDAVSTGPCRSVLRTRLHALVTTDSPLDQAGRRVAARMLRLGLEVHLSEEGAKQRALWRSGLLEIEELWPLAPSGPELSEASRRRTLQRLAGRAAEQIVELLESTPGPVT